MGGKRKFGKGKKSWNNGNNGRSPQLSQGAQLQSEGEAELIGRMFGLVAARRENSSYDVQYFHPDRTAQVLRVGVLDAKRVLDDMVGMGAMEKAGKGNYAPTRGFDKAHARYMNSEGSGPRVH